LKILIKQTLLKCLYYQTKGVVVRLPKLWQEV